MKRIIILTTLSFFSLTVVFGQIQQYKSKYPDIPIVDVHVHTNGTNVVSEYLQLMETVKKQYGSNLAYIVGLASDQNESLANFIAAGKNRFLFSISTRVGPGWTDNSSELIGKVKNGFVGVKFWGGPYYRRYREDQEIEIRHLDDPKLAPYFASLEKANVLMTSLHTTDPNGPFDNRQVWLEDPVEFWQNVRAFENVVAKYPKLTIIAAHCAWIFCQDAQLDYLRYMFATYPNLYVDISATFQYMPLMNYDNLRDIFIEYQDRFLFGSDFGGRVANKAEAFASNFAILESDLMIPGDITGVARNNGLIMKGLNLPKEVLEKIYYKNALKLYPGLKELMGKQ